MINKISSNTYTTPSFNGRNDLNKKQKATIMASSVAGITPVIAVLAKRKGYSLNPKRILNTPIKDWAIFKYSPKSEAINYADPKVITAIAASSVAGGFVGGSIVDKSNVKAKKREILNQILGNVLVPVTTVYLGSKLFEKYQNRLEAGMPQFKPKGSVTKFFNKVLRKLPQAAATLTALGTGIYLGNRVSNLINEKLYHKKVDRKIRATDFAPHVDDLCMATTMMDSKSTFGPKLGRVIPLALIVPGYQTGIAQE